MDKYINMLFVKLSQYYKVNIITIMSYNETRKRPTKIYKLVISHEVKEKGKKVTKEKISLDFFNKHELALEMIKWIKQIEGES